VVAHACNPSYSEGRNQEDHSSKPAQANNYQDPISKNPSQKRAGGVAQGEGLEFKCQYQKKNKQKEADPCCFVPPQLGSGIKQLKFFDTLHMLQKDQKDTSSTDFKAKNKL
jgi:hypothetical protein